MFRLVNVPRSPFEGLVRSPGAMQYELVEDVRIAHTRCEYSLKNSYKILE